MSRHDWKNELSELIVRKLDGSLSDDEFKRLETILSEDPATVQFYVKVIITNALLEDKSSIPIGEGEVHQALELSLAEQPLDSDVSTLKRWQVDAQLHEIEQYAEMEFERFREQERKRQEELAYREYRAWRRRYILAAGSLAAFVAIVFFVWLVPQLEPNLSGPIARTIPAEPALVATLVKAQNALWEQGNASAEVGSRLRALPGFLKQGLIQITFDDGAEVILQAPCHFCLDDAGRITLFRGVLSAVVSEQAKGFAVQTPTGVVTDYGTEFGVIARENGETETQVYIGKVLLEGNPDLVSTHAPRSEGGRSIRSDPFRFLPGASDRS